MNTVLIADDNKNWAEALGEAIAQDGLYSIEAICTDGQDALAQIKSRRPDIIILDIVMPQYDGVYIARQVRTAMPGYHPILYILSGIGSDSVIRAISEVNVDFFSMKPIAIELILRNLQAVATGSLRNETRPLGNDAEKTAQAGSPSRNVRETILQLGLTPNLPSTLYVIAALDMCLETPNYYGLLTKVFYPEIAKTYDTNAWAVERNIRSAILQVIKKKTPLYQRIFGHVLPGKITNNEFLSRVADYIRNA